MGRRRRLARLDDNDDGSAAEAPKAKSSGGAGSAGSNPKKQPTPQQRRRVAAAASDEEEEEDDEKDLEAMRRDEEEDRREEETQTRRRRGRPKRRAPESDDEEEAEEKAEPEEEPREESTEPVPIGNPVKVTGKGKKQKKHYASFEYEGNTFEIEDPVLLTPEDRSQKPYVAIVKDITETEGSLNVTGQWFYRPEEADKKGGGSWIARDTRELFYSFHIDDVPAESVMHKCVVHFIPLRKQIPSRKQHPGFIVQKIYDAVEKKLWNLTDKDYEDNKQQEIDLLVKKTMDRIGELPDLEPLEDTPANNTDHVSNKRNLRKKPVNPIDVTKEPSAGISEHFAKAETPGSDKPKNYAILVRYKAVTGNQSRDKWLDKLLDSIPLALKESAGASEADPGTAPKSSANGSSAKGSDDNEKSYVLDDVVPIMVALERSAYDALGTDFGKYNQKLRQLWFNIKAGLTSAEKASEPEELRQLQMTDARCQRCQEKKVGISDIIHAGHGDRYQLECTSCGHTWFSSYDAISSLTVDGPSTAGNVGTAPWATAKFDVLEKQLTIPRDQPDKSAANALQKSTAAYMPTLEKQKSFRKPKPEEPSPAPAPNHE
ncbi:protein REPRESSOR OF VERNALIZATION 1-like isoform X2 [Phragmites australis]|uniref:protein REPRESSOR OF VERNALIZATION 1-like isoform X2 n=1 Tax=Phragmites australis TaxID=29695 RepID=UPI002D783A80|nr:protein REPRESSOR OF VERNALIZATION 1-like isoform X2 [Phragmites australis]